MCVPTYLIPLSFINKDAFLEKYHAKDLFGTEQRQDVGRPIKSLLVSVTPWFFPTSPFIAPHLSSLPSRPLITSEYWRQVVIFWSCLLVYGVVEFFLWSSLLTSWEGIVIVVAALVLVTLAMQILIQSSESNRSTPIEALQQDPAGERLLQKWAVIYKPRLIIF